MINNYFANTLFLKKNILLQKNNVHSLSQLLKNGYLWLSKIISVKG